MPLGKIQTQIVAALEEAGRLTAEQRAQIAAVPDELPGDALDKLLQEEYRVTPLQLVLAKGKAFRISPFNVTRYKVTPQTFERLPQEFCQEHLVLPVGVVGDLLLVAFANPFEVTLPTKIQEMTGLRVVRLLGREKDLREKFAKGPEHKAADFADVVEAIGAEFGTEH
ncbi:MAG TPA: type II/IV secretion system protein, partial [Opitutaceae bacterium]